MDVFAVLVVLTNASNGTNRYYFHTFLAQLFFASRSVGVVHFFHYNTPNHVLSKMEKLLTHLKSQTTWNKFSRVQPSSLLTPAESTKEIVDPDKAVYVNYRLDGLITLTCIGLTPKPRSTKRSWCRLCLGGPLGKCTSKHPSTTIRLA